MPNYFKIFVKSEQFAGVLLLVCTLVALIFANSSFSGFYHNIFILEYDYHIFNSNFHINANHLINDGLMSIFFLHIGLEIKREIISGELSNSKKAILPVIGAFGGMLFPALIFIMFNIGIPTISGWGIPTATDIAFSLTILSLIKGVPKNLKIFLVALAVTDDIGAIFIIGIFYTNYVIFSYLFLATIIILILLALNKYKISNIYLHLFLGAMLWFFISNSGIHSTISGVILAFLIPYDFKNENSMLLKIEKFLHAPVNYFILPLFAFANTGIIIQSNFISSLGSYDSLGIIAGLCIGKPLGILTSVYLSIKFKITELPKNINFIELLGVAILCGIGFTMSLFISTLAYKNHLYIDSSKISVLIASFLSAIIGFLILKFSFKNKIHKIK